MKITFDFPVDTDGDGYKHAANGERFGSVVELIGQHKRVRLTLNNGEKLEGYLVPESSCNYSLMLTIWDGEPNDENPVTRNRVWVHTAAVKQLVVLA
jgi:hypothetical protein